MGRLYQRIAIQVAILAVVLYCIWPPEKQLKFGKDLAGGISLVYSLQLSDTDDATEVMAKVAEALKNRVDPNGVMEISIQPMGRDRLEISMPLPRQEVKELRAVFESKVKKLGEFKPTQAKLSQAFELAGDKRDARLAEISAGQSVLLDKLKEAATLYDARWALDKRLEELTTDIDAVERAKVIAQRAEVNPKYREVVDTLLANAVSPDVVRRVLELPTQTRRIKDPLNGEAAFAIDPSQQEMRLADLLKRYPLRVAEIKDAVEAFATYASQRKTLDDPQDLVRMLRGAGVLSFRIPIAVGPGDKAHPEESQLRQELREKGPTASRRPDARWFKINQIANWYDSVPMRELLMASPQQFFASRKLVGEPYLDGYYILCWDTDNAKLTPDNGVDWGVASAGDDRDEMGKPAVRFVMNTAGAALLNDLTRTHVGEPMAVLLDDEVYTAPNLNSAISKQGIITGIDSEDERRYVIKVLAAGALQAKLSPEPVSRSIVGPTLGADNLRASYLTGAVAFVLVAGFMVVYYFGSGAIAVVALIYNLVLVLAIMAMNKAAFTLPGIAGVVLTFGQAVDSNVLVYERMREEFHRGADLKTAVRLGFSRALPPIIDGNVSNLIICVVLGYFGTQEIRGFAVTLGIGVLTTLFTTLVVSRLMFTVLIERFGWRHASQLPMAVPFVQRLLSPHVNWMKHRWGFLSTLVIFLGAMGYVTWHQGVDLLGMEFRSGTAVTLTFKQTPGPDGKLVQMKATRAEVDKRIKAIEAAAPEGSPLKQLREARILAVNPDSDMVTSSTFTIKSRVTDPDAVQNAIVVAFRDMVESQPPLHYKGSDQGPDTGPLFPIVGQVLGESINMPGVRTPSGEFAGGLAIVLENIEPRVSVAEIESRVAEARAKFTDVAFNQQEVVLLKGTEDAAETAVILVRNPSISYRDDPSLWATMVRNREWGMVNSALTEVHTLASVQSFTPAIAKAFAAQGVICTVLSLVFLTIFVFIRFGTARWAIAATVPLFADVIGIIGLIGVAQLLHDTPATHGIARSLGILPFELDLAQIAAVLTIVGYSLNDKIIILDRIRENKGKSLYASAQMINDSINQTLSRTFITAGVHMITTIALYIFGGEALRGFAYTFSLGVILGTYTSIVSTPLVWSSKLEKVVPPGLPPGIAPPAAVPALEGGIR
ncbi:MAG: protein translocase subunit SecD [Planctomycetota bacterium]